MAAAVQQMLTEESEQVYACKAYHVLLVVAQPKDNA